MSDENEQDKDTPKEEPASPEQDKPEIDNDYPKNEYQTEGYEPPKETRDNEISEKNPNNEQ